MSESVTPKEPLNPRTHIAIVNTAKGLVNQLVVSDRARGFDPITLMPGASTGIHRPVFDLIPKFDKYWRGKFFNVPSADSLLDISMYSPVSRDDPDQKIYISTSFITSGMSEAEVGVAYRAPFKSVAIILAEALPEVREVPEMKPVDEAITLENQMSEPEGQDLLEDLRAIIDMQ